MRRLVVWLLLVFAFLSCSGGALAQGIVTRLVVQGGSANSTTIFAGSSVTIEVRIDSPALSPIGTIYRLKQTLPANSGYLSVVGRSYAGSPFNDPAYAVPDATVTAAPGNLLDAESDYNLGANTIGLVGAAPANNILVTTLTISSSLSTPAGTYRIQPTQGNVTEVTTDPGGFDWSMDSAFFDLTIVVPTVPNPPTGVTATAGDTYATVTFTPPANNGGSPIIGYTVTSTPAGGTDIHAGTTATTHIVTGLASGTPYTFRVTATNLLGTSTPSAPSNSVTPQLSPCTYAVAPLDLPNRPHAGGAVNVIVTTPAGCPVTATFFQPWVSLISITPSGGTTTVSLQISANPGAARSTSIVLAGRLFHITQQ